jgi:hypothetical protein
MKCFLGSSPHGYKESLLRGLTVFCFRSARNCSTRFGGLSENLRDWDLACLFRSASSTQSLVEASFSGFIGRRETRSNTSTTSFEAMLCGDNTRRKQAVGAL